MSTHEFRTKDPVLIAMQTALRVLFASHPNPDLLKAAFRAEYQSTISLLEMQGAAPLFMSAYKDCLGDIVPEPSSGTPA
jgi:hypothetical protein